MSGPGLSLLVLAILAAGFSWGLRAAWGLVVIGSWMGVVFWIGGTPAGLLVGPWTTFGAVALLLSLRKGQWRAQGRDLQKKRQMGWQRVILLREERERQRFAIQSREEAVQEINEMYQLSKQFLATLEWEEALRITEEAVAKEMPQLKESERAAYLRKVQSHVEKGDVSVEALIQDMPLAGTDSSSREKWGIVSGQLALGLKRISLYRQVQELATHDGLTGLLVRRYFRERLEEELARTFRRSGSLAFLMVDLDWFKQVNDTYGHLVGDVVLREVARRIRSSVREIDWVGRYGGEEFGVALPESSPELAVQIAERIRRTVEGAPIRAYDEEIPMTVSVGVALCPQHASAVDALIERADEAMYRAKALGRNQTVTSR